ncbi:MAG: 50S ribosomal protein L31e [Nanoarchaeota archaeon]|nr:50S ribosomal protein L31e [Nanoarchaeota archaeon]MBU1051466.1 50S ribosomal protein L31e [Nanoarchaeota archaeon]
MADKKTTPPKIEEKEYIIPLRKEWRKVANYRRTGRAIKAIKKFIVRHMKVPDRDISKVKLDMWLNQEIWFKGKKKPPAKIKVKAVKEGDIVRVTLSELPDFVKFEKAKRERRHKPSEKPKEPVPTEAPKEEEKKEETPEEKEEKKKQEKEKSQSVAEQKAAQAKQQAKQQKQSKLKETPIHRMALKK